MPLNFMPILPPQASQQAQAQVQQAHPQIPPQALQGGQGRRAAIQDWRALRPHMQPGMDRAAFQTQMQDWRGLRPQMGGPGGMRGNAQGGQMSILPYPMPPQQGDLAARHAAMLQQARPTGFAPQQAATSGFAAQVAPQVQSALTQRPRQPKPLGY